MSDLRTTGLGSVVAAHVGQSVRTVPQASAFADVDYRRAEQQAWALFQSVR
jgi:hypothetical protein